MKDPDCHALCSEIDSLPSDLQVSKVIQVFPKVCTVITLMHFTGLIIIMIQ